MSDSANPRVKKAGVIIHGYQEIDSKRRHLIVAPWSQGRCVNNAEKFYFLSKGTVDKGEDYKAAALRETLEETGIDVSAIPQSDIVEASEIDRTIVNPIGHSQRMWVRVIKIRDIVSLRSQLKNQTVQSSDASFLDAFPATIDESRTAQTLSSNKPDFETLKARLLDFLQAGRENHDLIQQVQNAESPDALGELRRGLDDDVKKKFDKAFGLLKKELHDQEVVGNDTACLKLDGRIRPLSFYQEGADLLKVSEYLSRIVKQAEKHPEYDSNMLGIREMNFAHGPSPTTFSTGLNHQLAVLMSVVTKEDIEDADISSTQKYILAAMHARCQREQKGLGR